MKVFIDGKPCEAEYGEYILDVAKRNGIHIPTLCHSDALSGIGSCRLCIVEVVEGSRRRVVTSCLYPVTREIEVFTSTEKIKKMRKTIIMLLSSRAPQNDYIKRMREEYGVRPTSRFKGDNNEQCILCGLCVKACEAIGTNAIAAVNRGITKKISTPYDEASEDCIGCGACAQVCPTGAIGMYQEEGKRTIWGRTFELLKCEQCGKYYATREQLKHSIDKLDGKKEMLCDRCKKKAVAASFKTIYEDMNL